MHQKKSLVQGKWVCPRERFMLSPPHPINFEHDRLFSSKYFIIVFYYLGSHSLGYYQESTYVTCYATRPNQRITENSSLKEFIIIGEYFFRDLAVENLGIGLHIKRYLGPHKRLFPQQRHLGKSMFSLINKNFKI